MHLEPSSKPDLKPRESDAGRNHVHLDGLGTSWHRIQCDELGSDTAGAGDGSKQSQEDSRPVGTTSCSSVEEAK